MLNYLGRSLCAVVLLIGAQSVSARQADDEVDFVELASVLLGDGHVERAANALGNVADPYAEDVDTPGYFVVLGLLHLERNELAHARDAFQSAIDEGLVDEATGEPPPTIYIYLAQCHYGLEDDPQAIAALDKAGQTAARLSATWLMRSHAHWRLGEKQRALDVLDQASDRFPGNHAFARRKVFHFVELGLFREASELGRDYLERIGGAREDYIAIGNALRQGGEHEEALQFLQVARLRYPDDVTVLRLLAHVYLEMDNKLAAAQLVEEASRLEPSFTGEAAEIYRRAGKLYHALTLNASIADNAAKLRQRLAILLELKRFEQITAMESAMDRVGLLEEEDMRYALAYAWFQSGNFSRAEAHLDVITRPDLFRKAVELRGAIEDCTDQAWRCG